MNLFGIKKVMGILLMGAIPPIVMLFTLMFTLDMTVALFGLLASIVVMFIIVNYVLISSPFLKALEGGGIPILTLDSTGIIGFFNAKKKGNRLFFKIFGQKKEALFDRNTLHYLAHPKPAEIKTQWNSQGEEYMTFRIKKSDYQQSVYGMQGMTCFIYNTITDTFLTKEMLIKMEDKILAHHMLKYTVVKIEELVSWLRDFGRYIMEQLRPKSSFFQSKIFWFLIVGGAILLMILLFANPIMEILQSGGGIQLPTTPITPRGA